MRRLLFVSALTVSVLCLAAPASASMLSMAHPAPRWVVELAGRATDFWADRGVLGCPGIESYEASVELEGARGAGGACRIWVSSDLVDSVSRESFTLVRFRAACSTITHEVGHALGLDHTETGVMSATLTPAWTPWFCRVWARWAVVAALAHDARFDYSATVRAG